MKIQEVILRAVSGQILWMHAAEIIGISDRSMRRWRRRYEEHGYDGLSTNRILAHLCLQARISIVHVLVRSEYETPRTDSEKRAPVTQGWLPQCSRRNDEFCGAGLAVWQIENRAARAGMTREDSGEEVTSASADIGDM